MPLKKRKVVTHGNAPLVHSIPANSGGRGCQLGGGPALGGPPPGGEPSGRGPRPRPRPRRRRRFWTSPSPLGGRPGRSPSGLGGDGRRGGLPLRTSPSPFAGEGRCGAFPRGPLGVAR